MPTDITPWTALIAIALGTLFGLGWHLAADLMAFLKARTTTLWDIIVIIIIIIIIIIVIVL